MERTVTAIEFDFTNHFGIPFTTKPDEQWYIDDVKRQVWEATTEADVKLQIELLYGFEVKNLVTDIVLEGK
tara:strand:- start:245 stop:457 length:213 start_codon:yes stop_codon:yes gene_type:complete